MGIFDFIKKAIEQIKFSYAPATNRPNVKNVTAYITANKNSNYKNDIELPEQTEEYKPFLNSCKDIPVQTDYIAYFRNGELYNLSPRNKSISLYEDRQTAYWARYIISDGIKYDLEDAESIKNMKIPMFNNSRGISSPTGNLDYILKMRLGTENRPHLAVPLAYKVANLMMASPTGWDKKDYYRVVIQLWSIGEIKYADYLLEELKKRLPMVAAEDDVTHHKKTYFDTQMKFGKYFVEDYVHIGFLGAVCPQCAPYQNRIYSLSGKDKRFPRLPDFIIQNRGLHCNLSIYPIQYYNGDTITRYIYKPNGDIVSEEVDAIKYSNRPFIDDRSDFEKKKYEEWKSKQDKNKNHNELYYDRNYYIEKYQEHLEYQTIVDVLGDEAPKSYHGYKRMKHNNTANFQKLLKIAIENGIKIS